MKVKELVEKLQQFNQDLEAVVYLEHYDNLQAIDSVKETIDDYDNTKLIAIFHY